MHLIEHNGERMIVASLKGHKGAKVLIRNVEHPPHGHAKLEGGKWVEDLEAKAIADEEARLRRMSRTELLEEAVRQAREALTSSGGRAGKSGPGFGKKSGGKQPEKAVDNE